jgi:hypothetical protein
LGLGTAHDTATVTVTPNRRLAIFIVGSVVAIALVVISIVATTTGPTPGKGQAGKAQKSHAPEHAITIHGTIQKAAAQDGTTSYTMIANGTTYRLSDGPAWWWGANDPLAAYVGRTVDVVGAVAEGSTEIDVQSVDGKALRSPGRPPWAGGPKVVGEKHPGSKPEASSTPSPSPSPSPPTSPSASPH